MGHRQASPRDVLRVSLILSFGDGVKGRHRWLVPGPLRLRERKLQKYIFSSFQFADRYLEKSAKRSINLVDIELAYPSAAVRITGLGTFLSVTGVSVEGLE